MHIEAILTQLDYTISPSSRAQVERVIANTTGFEHVDPAGSCGQPDGWRWHCPQHR